MKLSPEQFRVLEAAVVGDLYQDFYMGWFQKGGYRIPGQKNALPATVKKLRDLGLIGHNDSTRTPSCVSLLATTKGRELHTKLSHDAQLRTTDSSRNGGS